MRIEDSGEYSFRKDIIQHASNLTGRNKSVTCMRAVEHLIVDFEAHKRHARYVRDLYRDGTLSEEQARELIKRLHAPDSAFKVSITLSDEQDSEWWHE